jgi:DNA-directed RNA polymerase specialized sigma subunit
MNTSRTGSRMGFDRNGELFTDFYGLQGAFAECLAGHPGVVRAWLEARPRWEPEEAPAPANGRSARAFRSARLSGARLRELGQLVARVEREPGERASLGSWLLRSVPVRTYLEMVDFARPSLRAIDPQADERCRDLTRMRDNLFSVNFGLAKITAYNRNRRDYSDALSAASAGLLDAIDRYVPGERSARFAYFAGYWIRYHLSRHAQKFGTTVAFPIHQHRLGRRIDNFLAQRRARGLPVPEADEICGELGIGREAYDRHRNPPLMLSLHGLDEGDGATPDTTVIEDFLNDPSPPPATALEEAEINHSLRDLYRTRAAPAVRVMLAYTRGIGCLAEAAEDYLADLQETALENLTRRWRVSRAS